MARRLLTAILLLVAIGVERMAYYSIRSVLAIHLVQQAHLASSDIGRMYQILAIGLTASPFLGGLVCVVIPARVTALLGAIIAASGYAMLASLPGDLYPAGLITLVAGLGLFRPAFLVTAGSIFSGDEARGAYFAFLYVALNIGALAASLLASAGQSELGFAVVAGAGAAGMLAVSVITAIVAALPWLMPDDPGDGPAEARNVQPSMYAIVAAVMLLAVMSFPAAMLSDTLIFFSAQQNGWTAYAPLSSAASRNVEMLISALNPLAILVFGPALGFLFLGFQWAKLRLPITVPLAAGLALTAAVAGLVLIPGLPRGPLLLLVVAGGMAETLVGVVVLARVSAGLHERAQGAVVALWLSISYAPSLVVQLIAIQSPWFKPVLAGLAASTLMAALAAAIATPFVQRQLRPAV